MNRTTQSLLLGAALAGVAVAPPAAGAAGNSVPTWDRHALLESAEGAHFEIDMGRIARSRASTSEGRALGRLMIKDHEGELHALKAVAKSLGVTLPRHPSIQERHEISDTARHTGRAFDRAYARLEVGDHIRDIQEADGELAEGSSDPVKALASKYRVVYKRHLAAFRRFAAHVGAK